MFANFPRRQLFLLFVLLFSVTKLSAQSYSFVYIQGDKQVPFYVKLEGEMLPRYGKNYCIISKLEPGPINIDILFQQNAYPPQHFVILVPENGYRGFMITKKGDQVSLYDLQQQFYLPAGNTADDDHAPTVKSAPPPVIAAAVAATTATVPVVVADNPQPAKSIDSGGVKTTQATTTNDNQPKFIDNIELNNDHNAAGVAAIVATTTVAVTAVTNKTSDSATETVVPPTNSVPAIVNSDCPKPLDNDAFDAIYRKAMQQDNEESKLGFLNQQLGNCYSAGQAGVLAKLMDSDAARYTFLKKVYPRITDQAAFPSLEKLFSNEQWKTYFQKLTNH